MGKNMNYKNRAKFKPRKRNFFRAILNKTKDRIRNTNIT
jgi:hypothetical protein